MPDPVPAVEYHERTKHSPEGVHSSDHRLDWENKPIPYKVYEDLPTVDLPNDLHLPDGPALRALAEDATDPDAASAIEPDSVDLARLCHHSVGITKTIERAGGTHRFRAAATTGALYHVDLYLVTGDLPDLDAGVYHYDPRTRSLDPLREGDYRGVLVDASGDEERMVDAPATVVATSTWWRNAWKYRARTYRHAFWDSGTSLSNLLAVATALDLPARVVTGFAEGPVSEVLGIEPDEEAPLELVPVGTGGSRAPDATLDGDVEPVHPETRPLSAERVEYPSIPGAYAASSIPDGDGARAWRRTRFGGRDGGRVGTREPGDGKRFSLDPVDEDAASTRPLDATIVRRGSCREYRREPLSFRKLSTVLDRAVRVVPMDVTDPDGPPLQFVDAYLIVNDVEEIAQGTYHYHPEEGELELIREGWFRREAARLALDQRLAMDAGVCVYFLTDLVEVVGRLGDRGYRVAQLEAAITAGRLYLAAYAHRDLGATGLTFYDDLVTAFFEPRADGQTPMFLLTMGRPA